MNTQGTLLVLLLWSLTVCALAQEAVIQDSAERTAWEVRPDPGAHYVKLSQDPDTGKFDEQSLRLDFTVEPQNDWWSVIKCTVGKNPDPEKYNGLHIACLTSKPIPAGAITASAGGIKLSPPLEKTPEWQYIDLKLPEAAAGKVKVELFLKHTIPVRNRRNTGLSACCTKPPTCSMTAGTSGCAIDLDST